MPRAKTLLALLMLLAASRTASAQDTDLSTRLMLSTFKLTDGKTIGSAFVLARKEDQQPRVLVTAAHVFQNMEGDNATLVARKQTAEGIYEKLNVALRIRQEGRSLWVRHPALDVAALEIALPPEAEVARLSVDLLATDEMLKKYEVHPGDILRSIGFPHAGQFEAHAAGFPIVRIGCLSSFPLLPTKTTQTFYFDYNSFEGDSGGPVFLDETQRYFGGRTQEGRVQLLLGLVHGQRIIEENFKTVYQSGQSRHRMGLGIIVHASAIRETIDMLGR